MADFPKISNPFEDETDFIDSVSATDAAKQATQAGGKIVMKQVIKPTAQQVNPNQAIVDFLYGADTPAPTDTNGDPAAAGDAPDAGIEQLNQATQSNPQQASTWQPILDPEQQMARSEKAQLTEEQIEQREKHRLHIRNYYTMGNKLDDIGQLEEQIAKVRQQREQEEQQKLQEEEEEKQQKEQEEEQRKQQLAQPSGKKTGVPQHVQREQNKAENKTGFSG